MAAKDFKATMKIAFGHIAKGKGYITQAQLQELLYVLGCKPLLEEPYYPEILAAVDPDKRNQIRLDPLLEKMHAMMTPASTEAQVKEALQVFDEDGKGKISKAELARALAAYSTLPKDQVASLLDANKSGESIAIEDVLAKLFGH